MTIHAPTRSFLMRFALAGIMVTSLCSSLLAADSDPSLDSRPSTVQPDAQVQPVGHRMASVQPPGFLRRSLARMTTLVPRRRLSLQTGSPCICPACDQVCHLDAKQVDVEQSCFEVESKVICIPRVVFPWQKSKNDASCDRCDGADCHCRHSGAKPREVRVLKVAKYKCPECKYTWTAKNGACVTACDSLGDQGDQLGCDAFVATECDQGCAALGPYSSQPMTYREFEPTGVESTVRNVRRMPELTGPQP
jgi:hypothetical protein